MSHEGWHNSCKAPSDDHNFNVTAVDTRILLIHWKALLWIKKPAADWTDESSGQSGILYESSTQQHLIWEIYTDG